ncbi:hypothetical protein ABG067_008904, partial [Albugo candida]
VKKNRVRERQQAIEQGLISDPSDIKQSGDVIDPTDTCLAKCPDFEMLDGELQNNIDLLEMDENENMDHEKAVKAHREYVAGAHQPPLPSDVRSPEALAVSVYLRFI